MRFQQNPENELQHTDPDEDEGQSKQHVQVQQVKQHPTNVIILTLDGAQITRTGAKTKLSSKAFWA